MRHRGVHYTLTLVEPGLWKWHFYLGGKVRTGRTRANMILLAAKRVRLVIDREQRMRIEKSERQQEK